MSNTYAENVDSIQHKSSILRKKSDKNLNTYNDSDLFGKTSWEHAPTDYKPPVGLVRGAAFIDRIMPMPVGPHGLS